MGIQALRGSVGAVVNSAGQVYAPFDPTLDDSQDNATATGTLTAPSDGSRWVLAGWVTSFTADPAAAVTITITGTSPITGISGTVTLSVTKGGPAPILLPLPLHFAPNTVVTIALGASGTGGVVGKVWPIAWKELPMGSAS